MIEEVRRTRFDDGNVINDPRRVRQQLTYPGTTLAVSRKLPFRAEKRRAILERGIHEGEALPLNKRIGNWLPMQRGELWFMVP